MVKEIGLALLSFHPRALARSAPDVLLHTWPFAQAIMEAQTYPAPPLRGVPSKNTSGRLNLQRSLLPILLDPTIPPGMMYNR